MFTPFAEDAGSDMALHGFLHSPSGPGGDCVVLTHGAGANCQSKLLVQISEALAASGFAVLRFDLPFRRARPHGPPPFGSAERDRDGLRRAVAVVRPRTKGRIYLGGHSYGGRQSTMLLADEPHLVDGLLLLAYPLHPPRKPGELRIKHFPKLTRPAFFVHGTQDPFGTISEMKSALETIPAPKALFEVHGAGHDLLRKGSDTDTLDRVARAFAEFQHTIASPG
jgi:predicted alpha/beta-hydrolase family hydrolase